MVGGRIVSVRRHQNYATILVQGTGCEWRDLRQVNTAYMGEIPTGGQIWWQDRHLFVKGPSELEERDIGRVGYATANR